MAWAWPAAGEPGTRTTGPKLVRRSLRPSAVKTFLIAYTELTDPRLGANGSAPTVSRSHLMVLCKRLLGPAATTWSPAAARRDLIFAHFLTPVGNRDLALGPAVAGLDPLCRKLLDAAAEQLREFPRWTTPDRDDDAESVGVMSVALDEMPDDREHGDGAHDGGE